MGRTYKDYKRKQQDTVEDEPKPKYRKPKVVKKPKVKYDLEDYYSAG